MVPGPMLRMVEIFLFGVPSQHALVLSKGIEDFRIRTVSYGEEKPAIQGNTEEAHAGNRRDEFVAVKLAR